MGLRGSTALPGLGVIQFAGGGAAARRAAVRCGDVLRDGVPPTHVGGYAAQRTGG